MTPASPPGRYSSNISNSKGGYELFAKTTFQIPTNSSGVHILPNTEVSG